MTLWPADVMRFLPAALHTVDCTPASCELARLDEGLPLRPPWPGT